MYSYPKIARDRAEIMAQAARQEPQRGLAFQGAPGANSYLAAQQYDPDGLPLPCFSFSDALDAVNCGDADRAMIPIENSQHGRVADIHFLLPESGLHIIDEFFIPIHHCLMAKSKGPFTSVLSHPQALGQCRHYLKEHNITPVSYADTAGAAAAVAMSDDLQIAAIAPAIASEMYGLQLIAENIEDADHNTTRFVVLARNAAPPPAGAPVMTSLLFEVKNIPAALYKAMGGFATNGVNSTKLESYIRGDNFSAAEFYLDIIGSPGDPAVDRALDELRYHSKWVRILGSYRQARARS